MLVETFSRACVQSRRRTTARRRMLLKRNMLYDHNIELFVAMNERIERETHNTMTPRFWNEINETDNEREREIFPNRVSLLVTVSYQELVLVITWGDLLDTDLLIRRRSIAVLDFEMPPISFFFFAGFAAGSVALCYNTFNYDMQRKGLTHHYYIFE